MNHKNNITLVLLTHNDSDKIASNFKWLDKVPRINEIIVVDDNSSDNTVQQLTVLGSNNRKFKISKHPLNNNFASQRNLGINRSNNDWILWLDPDEIPDSQMISFLNTVDLKDSHQYSFKRLDTFLGQTLTHGENGANRFIRLFNKTNGKFVGQVHEVWQGSDPVVDTNLIIYHEPHTDFYSFIKKINFYSTLRAQELHTQGVHTNLFEIIIYPLAKFKFNYLIRLGFLDGTPGIIMALSMSFHSFLVRAKLWHLWQKKSF